MERQIRLDDDFARLLTLAARAADVEPNPVVIEQIEEIEEEFVCRIPDPVLGYFAAGLAGRFDGGGSRNIAVMRELTLTFRDILEEQIESGFGPRYDHLRYVIFEHDNANYLGFAVDAGRGDETLYFFDHEGMYSESPASWPLSDRLETFTRDLPEEEVPLSLSKVEPFEPEIVSRPRPAPEDVEEEPELRVTHVKFGAGRVIRRDEDGPRKKWLVAFDSGEEKLLLADFLDVQ